MKPRVLRCPKCGSLPQRSLEQNARMWPMLREISRQVAWHGQRLNEYEWKDVFTAGLKRQRVVPGLDGGFVVLGTHTSQMTTEEMSDLMMLIEAFADSAPQPIPKAGDSTSQVSSESSLDGGDAGEMK